MPLIAKIVSGGQTGADRAGLDFAIEHGIPHGGWCPKGRLAEDGPTVARSLQLEGNPKRQSTNWGVSPRIASGSNGVAEGFFAVLRWRLWLKF